MQSTRRLDSRQNTHGQFDSQSVGETETSGSGDREVRGIVLPSRRNDQSTVSVQENRSNPKSMGPTPCGPSTIVYVDASPSNRKQDEYLNAARWRPQAPCWRSRVGMLRWAQWSDVAWQAMNLKQKLGFRISKLPVPVWFCVRGGSGRRPGLPCCCRHGGVALWAAAGAPPLPGWARGRQPGVAGGVAWLLRRARVWAGGRAAGPPLCVCPPPPAGGVMGGRGGVPVPPTPPARARAWCAWPWADEG